MRNSSLYVHYTILTLYTVVLHNQVQSRRAHTGIHQAWWGVEGRGGEERGGKGGEGREGRRGEGRGGEEREDEERASILINEVGAPFLPSHTYSIHSPFLH